MLALLQILKDPQVREASEYYECKVAAVTHLCRFYAICDSLNFHLTAEEHRIAQASAQSFLDCYTWLCDWAITNHKMQWQVTIKFHYFKHGAAQAKFLNPKFGSCYKGERHVGKVAKVALSCSYGKPAWAISEWLQQKLQILVLLVQRRQA